MKGRTLVALSLALVMVLPAGSVVGAFAGDDAGAPPVVTPSGGVQVLPGYTPGSLSFDEVRAMLLDTAAVDNKVEGFGSYVMGVAGPNHARWLHNHAKPVNPITLGGLGLAACLTGPQTISADVVIAGSVCYANADITFTVPELGHREVFVPVGASLTITDSVIRGGDGDRLEYGLVTAEGGLTLDGNRFEQMVVYSAHDEPEAATHVITDNFFTNTLYGVFIERDRVTVERNTFFKNNNGVFVNDLGDLAPNGSAATWGTAQNPEVRNNTFEMNEVGIRIWSDQNPDNPEVLGTYDHNEIRANIIGIGCYSSGWYNPENPEEFKYANFRDNNVYNNWGDAVNNLRGVTIVIPLVGAVSVADSACQLDHNYYSADSLFLSSHDSNTNPSATPIANSAPALPHALVVISSSTTWSSTSPPPAITGPVYVKSPATLTIRDVTLASDYTIGASKGGRLIMDNVVVNNGNGFVLRNDNDQIVDSTFTDTQLFDPITVFRNNATTIQNNVITGHGRDRNTALSMAAGQFVDDFTWTPGASGNTISNTIYGVGGAAMTITLSDNVFKDIGLPADGYPLNLLLTAGFYMIIGTYNNDGNKYLNVMNGGTGQVVTLNSQDEVYDRGVDAWNGNLASTLTYTRAVFANLEYVNTNLLDSYTIANSNITYNAHGFFGAAATTVTISNTDFWNNFGPSVEAYDIDLNLNGQDTQLHSSITCTNCWSPNDEAYTPALYGSSTTYTAALASNNPPKPDWAGQAIEADNRVVTLGSGKLPGPAIARHGGELRILDANIDMDGFGIGAKGGGQAGAQTPGKLTIARSVFTNGGFIGLNSTASSVTNSVFVGSKAGQDLFSLYWGGGNTFECNFVDMQGAYPGRLNEMVGAGDTTFQRNLFTNSGDLDAGLGFFGDTYHSGKGRMVFKNNGYTDGQSAVGAVFGSLNITYAFTDNNFLDNDVGVRAGRRVLRDITGTLPVTHPTATDLRGNYWGAADGGRILNDTTVMNAGSGLSYDEVTALPHAATGERGPLPLITPFAAAPNAITPCIGWTFSPAAPFDFQSVSFSSSPLTFDPSGFAIASYAWNFNGEGASTQANPTFKFPDGGAKTVTLTVTTVGGKTASLSKTVNVAHSKPVPNFSLGSGNELSDIGFTDTSTHPNAPVDAPPAGWAYLWDFNGEGTSTAQNPTFNFADGGSKTIKLTVTDNDGQTGNISKVLSVAHVAPVPTFNVAGALETDTFSLTDTSTHPNAPVDGITTRAWSCSDGFTSAASSVSHKFPDGPSASCTLTVGDNDGQSAQTSKSFAVGHVAPVAGFSNPASSELDTIQFTDASTHPNAPTDAPPAGWAYAWDFNGEGASSARNPAFGFADGGSKAISLTVTDNDGQSSVLTRAIEVAHVAPIAAFSNSPSNPEPGALVSFADLSSHPNAPVDSIVSWSWDFAGLGTSTDPNPTFTFVDMGQYPVTLTVTDDDGIVGVLTRQLSIGNLPPVPAFTATPDPATVFDAVQFTDGSTDPDGSIVDRAWDLGDGTLSSATDPSHQYADDGTYRVCLTVTDDLGLSDTLCQDVVVANIAPGAAFHTNPPAAVAGGDTHFLDDSGDQDGDVVAWAWDLGDGATSAEQSPTHVYAAGGDYTVSLTVTDDDGSTDTLTRNVHVCETQLVDDGGHIHAEACTQFTLQDLLDAATGLPEQAPGIVQLLTDLVLTIVDIVLGMAPPLEATPPGAALPAL
jgi:PKD repeat protein